MKKASTRPRRVAWFSPYSRASDISRFSGALFPHMAAERDPKWSFALFVNDNGPRFECALPTSGISSPDDAASLLSFFDFPIYNVGNNNENHGQIVRVLRKRPGIVILHDLVYQHLIAWECLERQKSRQLYARLMGELYGASGIDATIRSGLVGPGPRRYSIWDTPLAEAFPFVEMIARLASGLVVHSEYAEVKARTVFDGPILRLALPWDQKPGLSDGEIVEWRERAGSGAKCVFMSFGHIGRSKNLHRVIQAFVVRPELAKIARLVIAGFPGDVGYQRELEQMVADNNLQACIRFEFSITDERLRQCKSEADAFVNIRSPVTESASGSLTEQFNTAKPVIVFSTGCYAEIPTDAAIKLDPRISDAGLADVMLAIAKDGDRRVAVGGAGQAYVRRIGGAEYVSKLKTFLVSEEDRLGGRQKFCVPITKASLWKSADLQPAEAGWFKDLTATRALWNGIDVDADCWSPVPILKWNTPTAIRYAMAVTLAMDIRADLEAAAVSIYEALGKWEFYRLLQLMRRKLWMARQEKLPDNLDLTDQQFISSPEFWLLATRFEPKLLARLCFISLLGRSWKDGEDLVWAHKFDSRTNRRSVIAEFLSAPEALARTAAISLVADKVLAWCAIDDVEVNQAPQRSVFKWPVLKKLNFSSPAASQSNALLEGDWFPAEPEGRWMGRFGTLRFMPTGVDLDKGVELELTFRVAATELAGPRTLTVSSSFGYADAIWIESDRPLSAQIPIPGPTSAAGEPVTVTLEMSNTVSLATLNAGTDARDLGIMLLGAQLNPARPSRAPHETTVTQILSDEPLAEGKSSNVTTLPMRASV